MNFYDILKESSLGWTVNPFAGRAEEGEWLQGETSIDFLNKHFGEYETAEEMINATSSEGFQNFFSWLRDEGILN